MITKVQYYYKLQYPDRSHDFTDNEHFEEFRDSMLTMKDITPESLDAECEDITPITHSPSRPKILSSGAISRKTHNLFRDKLKGGTEATDIQRFLINKVYEYSQLLGELNQELVDEWNEKIEPHLKNLSIQQSFKTLLGIFGRILTLSSGGSKTRENYLKVKNQVEEDEDEKDVEDEFKIPG
jgi:hypothetical protein